MDMVLVNAYFGIQGIGLEMYSKTQNEDYHDDDTHDYGDHNESNDDEDSQECVD